MRGSLKSISVSSELTLTGASLTSCCGYVLRLSDRAPDRNTPMYSWYRPQPPSPPLCAERPLPWTDHLRRETEL